MVEQTHRLRTDAAPAQRTTLLATFPAACSAAWHTVWRHARAINTNRIHFDDQNRRSPSTCYQQHAIVRVIVAVSSNFFSMPTFAENNPCVR
jgi:hypothetical protein